MSQPLQTKQKYLRELVYEKNRWDEPLSEEDKATGFLGWHERGYLPHCDKPGLIQFVTFRLEDSMPIAKRGEWEHLLSIEDSKEKRTKLEEYLDRSAGECYLKAECIAKIAEDALLHFHHKEYELLAWCVMPNHIHVLVHVWDTPLCRMIQRWKRYSSSKALKVLRSERQTFWQRDYWDTFMRDVEQERAAIRYIENNPLKARLCKSSREWLFSSARFRDEYHRLAIPSA
jgi:REP element-mobilizing transposase RayT